MKTVKCLPVDVFRSHYGDCSNGGISAGNNTLYLECERGFLDKDPSDPTCLRLVKREFGGGTYYHAESYTGKAAIFSRTDGATVGPLFGGTFIYTSDSRFPADYPIPLHDRYETPEQYDALSR